MERQRVWEDFSKYDQKWKQQVLGFDFWEEEKKQEAEKLQDQKEKLPHFPEPKNDNEYLLECQWQYRHGDDTALVKMYKRARTLGLKFINAIGQSNSHVAALTYEAKKIKAEDAATYMIEQYIKRPNFEINKNFPGYLFLRIAHELYYRRKVDKVVDFVDLQKFLKEGYDDKDDELISQREDDCLLGTRDIIQYEYQEEVESEEDQEQREAKAFYMWKQKQKINGGSK
jgi:hypothetical protein